MKHQTQAASFILFTSALLIAILWNASPSHMTAEELFRENYGDYDIAEVVNRENDCIIFAAQKPNAVISVGNTLACILHRHSPNGEYEIAAEGYCEAPMTPGFSANVISSSDLTIVFGKLGKRFSNPVTERYVDISHINIKILLSDGTENVIDAEKNSIYFSVFDGEVDINDIEYILGNEVLASYSQFFGKD